MKNFKTILLEIKQGQEWNDYIHSTFGSAERDVSSKRELDQPATRFARYHLFSSLDWSYGTKSQFEPKKTVSLPITKVHQPSDDVIAIHLDASLYHSDLDKHDMKHEDATKIHKWTGENPRKQPSSQLELQDLITSRLGSTVPIHKIHNDLANKKLIIHVPLVSVDAAMKKFKDNENKKVEDFERDNDENI
jgi:hypothetical protein